MATRLIHASLRGLGAGLVAGSAFAMAACSTTPNVVYAGPGWYLEKPRQMVAAGPQLWAGPFSYDQCEAERTKLPPSTAERMLCFRQLTAPGVAGPYVTDMDFQRAVPVAPSPDSVTASETQRVSRTPLP